MIVYKDGEFLEGKEASLPILDIGFLRGFGGFEFLRTYEGKLFHFTEHINRLKNTLDRLEISISLDQNSMEKTIKTLMKRNHLDEAFIKIIVTGGVSKDHITPGNPSLIIMTFSPYSIDPSLYEKGIKVITYPYVRKFPEIKSLNYTAAVLARKQALKQGAYEALYCNEKKEIIEGALSNFFAFKGNTLITSKESVLKGVTRKVVLSLAKQHFPIELRPISVEEIPKLSEAFITSSSKKILPIREIDSHFLPSKKGKNTELLMKLFEEHTFSLEPPL